MSGAIILSEGAAVAQVRLYLGVRGLKVLRCPENAARCLCMPITSGCLCILSLTPLWGALNHQTVPRSHDSSMLFFLFFFSVDLKTF